MSGVARIFAGLRIWMGYCVVIRVRIRWRIRGSITTSVVIYVVPGKAKEQQSVVEMMSKPLYCCVHSIITANEVNYE